MISTKIIEKLENRTFFSVSILHHVVTSGTPTVSISLVQNGAEEPEAPFGPEETPQRAIFQVVRSGNTGTPLTLTVYQEFGTALVGTNYEAFNSQVTIPAGSLRAEFSVIPIWHEADEETLVLDMAIKGTSVGGYAINQTVADANIYPYFLSAIHTKEIKEEGDPDPIGHEYTDTQGNITVGIGHNMGPVSTNIGVAAFETATGVNFDAVKSGKTDLTPTEINSLFDSDLSNAALVAEKAVSNFISQPLDIKIVLVDLVFNIGSLVNFPNFTQDIVTRNYEQASYDLMHKTSAANSPPSLYATQLPARSQRNNQLIQDVISEMNGGD